MKKQNLYLSSMAECRFTNENQTSVRVAGFMVLFMRTPSPKTYSTFKANLHVLSHWCNRFRSADENIMLMFRTQAKAASVRHTVAAPASMTPLFNRLHINFLTLLLKWKVWHHLGRLKKCGCAKSCQYVAELVHKTWSRGSAHPICIHTKFVLHILKQSLKCKVYFLFSIRELTITIVNTRYICKT